MTNADRCTECDNPRSHALHLDDPHGYANRDNQYDCNFDADWQGEESGYKTSCDHHEFTLCAAEDIGADECRCEECIERLVSAAEYARESMEGR